MLPCALYNLSSNNTLLKFFGNISSLEFPFYYYIHEPPLREWVFITLQNTEQSKIDYNRWCALCKNHFVVPLCLCIGLVLILDFVLWDICLPCCLLYAQACGMFLADTMASNFPLQLKIFPLLRGVSPLRT